MNSWDKSDSDFNCDTCGDCYYKSYNNHTHIDYEDGSIEDLDWCNHVALKLGENDLKLMRNLARAGSDHGKFLRMINVTCDITAPLYWWKEFSTYKVGTVANSCSTMHKIHAKELTLDDFSHEHLKRRGEQILRGVIGCLNEARNTYLFTKDKDDWWQMIQLLPSSYNQRRTIQMNYEVLRNMYFARKNHKLDERHTFCKWVERLPHFREIFLEG